MFGKHKSEESKQKQRLTNRIKLGYTDIGDLAIPVKQRYNMLNEEEKAKRIEDGIKKAVLSRKGKKHSEEHKRKIGEGIKYFWETNREQALQNLSKGLEKRRAKLIGKKHTPEHIEKIRLGMAKARSERFWSTSPNK